jgi:YVTN family beta-propeller protein
MRHRSVLGVVVFGLSGALVGVVPDGVSVAAGRAPCRATALVANTRSGTVSTIGVKTRTKNPTDIAVGSGPTTLAVTPDGKTAFVTNALRNTVSTIDVKTREKHPADVPVGARSRSGWRSRRTARPPSSPIRAAAPCRRST